MRLTTGQLRAADRGHRRRWPTTCCDGRVVAVTEGGYDLRGAAPTRCARPSSVAGGRWRPATSPAGRRRRLRGDAPIAAVRRRRSPRTGSYNCGHVGSRRTLPAWSDSLESTVAHHARLSSPQELDKKWQQRWADSRAFEVTVDPSRPKFYCLEMFAYPSGHAHVGHVRNYIIGDVMARTKRMRGYNVLHPFGWDAFGLPAENAAIKNGIHPEVSTRGNIAHMKGQLQRLGISYAWERELATCDPEYYKWNQWLFIRMFETGPGLPAQVVGELVPELTTPCSPTSRSWTAAAGAAARRSRRATSSSGSSASPPTPTSCSTRTTTLTGWPEKVLTMQRNWIGRSEGARVQVLPVGRADPTSADPIEVFTTRIDTIFGATFVLLGPEHPLVDALRGTIAPIRRRSSEQAQAFRLQDRAARISGEIEKQGFDTGFRAINPFTERAGADLGRELRARRVRHRRGHGRAGARPARLRVRAQVQPADPRRRARPTASPRRRTRMTEAAPAYGTLVDSGEFSGLPSEDAQKRMIACARQRGHRRGRRSSSA